MKRILYVLRTALTGTHLLETSALLTDVSYLFDAYALGDARALVERKRAGERTPLDTGERERWRARIDALLARLDAARDRSILPEEPRDPGELDAFLVEVRRARF